MATPGERIPISDDDLQFGSPGQSRELLRLTPDGRVFVITDDGKAWEIDGQVLYEALAKFRRN